ncbi:MAG: hypothetical protein AAF725_06915 [Acidobacteriota bacterium]
MSATDWRPIKPVNLHLAHSWGGGLGRWAQDFALADPYSQNLVLESFGAIECYGVGLRLRRPEGGEILGSWVLSRPVSEMRSSDPEYATLLKHICREYGVAHLYVSSLIGLTLDVFRLGVPATLIYHDYFTYCPALYLTRGGVCTSCTADDLVACSGRETGHRPKGTPGFYAGLRSDFFAAVAAAEVHHVCPSGSLITNLRRIDERFRDIDFKVIEHGLSYAKRNCFGGAEESRRLRVGLLGVLSWNKGSAAFGKLFETLRLIADFSLIGAHEPGLAFGERWSSSVLPRYEQAELPAVLERHRLDLTLFLSRVPETFSYTLSESWCFGIPPAARPIGAQGDRIVHGETGFLFELEDDSLVDFLLWADRERDELRRVAARVATLPVRTLEEAVQDYYSLRADGYWLELEQTLGAALAGSGRAAEQALLPGPAR